MKATTDGVVLTPSAFSITLGVEPSIKATQELVVPRSMPITDPDLAEENDLNVSACLKIVLIMYKIVEINIIMNPN